MQETYHINPLAVASRFGTPINAQSVDNISFNILLNVILVKHVTFGLYLFDLKIS